MGIHLQFRNIITKGQINEKSEDDIPNIINSLKEHQSWLHELSVDDIIEYFDKLGKHWKNEITLHEKFGISLEHIVDFISKENLMKELSLSLRGNYKVLDTFCTLDNDAKRLYHAQPRGLAVHWIAGNVPVLGVISLFQSLLTKNKSIVKVPANFKNLLPTILEDLNDSSYFSKPVKEIIDTLLSSVLILYIDQEDFESQQKLSRNADIRIVWGGLEAVSSVIRLEKKINCRDIIFGPKISLAYVSKNRLQDEKDLTLLSKALADDIFAFDQAGCNSPHNLLIEKGSKYNIHKIAKNISESFDSKSRGSNHISEPIDKFNLLTKKFLYQSNDKFSVISGSDDEWGVFINKSNTTKIEEPLYGRTVFLSEVKNLEEIGKILPTNIQSLGLFTKTKEKDQIIQTLSNFGVDRFPDIGKMSLYENPWDGYMPLQQMVKWISSN